MSAYNSFFYVFGLFLFAIIIWITVKYIKKQHYPPTDSFYYRIEDLKGNKSIIHNSGIKPSETVPGSVITFSILKISYNDGKSFVCEMPRSLWIGYHPKELFIVPITQVIESDDIYKIETKCPIDNPLYQKVKVKVE